MRNLLFCFVGASIACLPACAKSAPPAASATPEPALDAGGPVSDAAPSASATSPATPAAAASGLADAGAAPPASAASATPDEPPMQADACAPASVELEKAARVAMRKCYEDAAKKKPDLAGTVRIAVNVDARGKISSTKPVDKSTLGDKVVDCIQKAIKATPFDGGKCQMRTMTIVHAYPH